MAAMRIAVGAVSDVGGRAGPTRRHRPRSMKVAPRLVRRVLLPQLRALVPLGEVRRRRAVGRARRLDGHRHLRVEPASRVSLRAYTRTTDMRHDSKCPYTQTPLLGGLA